MWQVKAVIGHVDAPGFGDRARERVQLDADTATKRRQIVVSEAGNEVAIDLPHGAYLRQGRCSAMTAARFWSWSASRSG